MIPCVQNPIHKSTFCAPFLRDFLGSPSVSWRPNGGWRRDSPLGRKLGQGFQTFKSVWNSFCHPEKGRILSLTHFWDEILHFQNIDKKSLKTPVSWHNETLRCYIHENFSCINYLSHAQNKVFWHQRVIYKLSQNFCPMKIFSWFC